MIRTAIFGGLLILWAQIADARHGGVGRVYPPEKREVENGEYGIEITQWTRSGQNYHLYFNIESFIDTGICIIYSDRAGKRNLFALDLADGSMTQMTDKSGRPQVYTAKVNIGR